MGACYKCGEPYADEGGQVEQDSACTQCSSWLHSCANCLYYDEYSQKKCREAKAAFVFDRLGKNECSYYKVKRLILDEKEYHKKKKSKYAERSDKAGKARENLDRLFG